MNYLDFDDDDIDDIDGEYPHMMLSIFDALTLLDAGHEAFNENPQTETLNPQQLEKQKRRLQRHQSNWQQQQQRIR